MFCIVGLGNPGPQYQTTRHNAGFLVVDRIVAERDSRIDRKGFKSAYTQLTYSGKTVILVKPQTFMNLSGEAVSAVVGFFKIPSTQLLVVYDDLDLPLGTIRFRTSGSSGGHRGLNSIISCLGTTEIPRLRIGIGRPPPNLPVVDYVLTRFTDEEQPVFNECVNSGAQAALSFVAHGPAYTMNHYNITAKSPQTEQE